MLAATSRRIVYIRILLWYTEVYYSQYYHISSRYKLIIHNYSVGEINHVSKNGYHSPRDQ